MISWQIYELTSEQDSLNGVMLRGRIRKFGIENDIDVLAENTEDQENGVRFAVQSNDEAERITQYLRSIIADVAVELVLRDVQNPVLSKMKVNDESRYTL